MWIDKSGVRQLKLIGWENQLKSPKRAIKVVALFKTQFQTELLNLLQELFNGNLKNHVLKKLREKMLLRKKSLLCFVTSKKNFFDTEGYIPNANC